MKVASDLTETAHPTEEEINFVRKFAPAQAAGRKLMTELVVNNLFKKIAAENGRLTKRSHNNTGFCRFNHRPAPNRRDRPDMKNPPDSGRHAGFLHTTVSGQTPVSVDPIFNPHPSRLLASGGKQPIEGDLV